LTRGSRLTVAQVNGRIVLARAIVLQIGAAWLDGADRTRPFKTGSRCIIEDLGAAKSLCPES